MLSVNFGFLVQWVHMIPGVTLVITVVKLFITLIVQSDDLLTLPISYLGKFNYDLPTLFKFTQVLLWFYVICSMFSYCDHIDVCGYYFFQLCGHDARHSFCFDFFALLTMVMK